jgi:hypothetical protein
MCGCWDAGICIQVLSMKLWCKAKVAIAAAGGWIICCAQSVWRSAHACCNQGRLKVQETVEVVIALMDLVTVAHQVGMGAAVPVILNVTLSVCVSSPSCCQRQWRNRWGSCGCGNNSLSLLYATSSVASRTTGRTIVCYTQALWRSAQSRHNGASAGW